MTTRRRRGLDAERAWPSRTRLGRIRTDDLKIRRRAEANKAVGRADAELATADAKRKAGQSLKPAHAAGEIRYRQHDMVHHPARTPDARPQRSQGHGMKIAVNEGGSATAAAVDVRAALEACGSRWTSAPPANCRENHVRRRRDQESSE